MNVAKFWPLAALGLVALGLSCYAGAIGRDAQTKAEIARLTRELATARGRLPKTDTVYAKAKATFTPARQRFDSLVIALGDPVKISPVILAADEALKACDVVIRVCEQRVAQRDTVIWAQDSVITLLRKRKPFLLRIGKPLAPFAAGVVAGLILTR